MPVALLWAGGALAGLVAVNKSSKIANDLAPIVLVGSAAVILTTFIGKGGK